MGTARQAFGACVCTDRIYVAGGYNSGQQILSSCEFYDLAEDKWSAFPSMPWPAYGHNLAAVNQRLLIGFGFNKTPHRNAECMLVLDTWNLNRGWSQVWFKNELNSVGCQQGLVPLTEGKKRVHELLIFGGLVNEETQECS